MVQSKLSKLALGAVTGAVLAGSVAGPAVAAERAMTYRGRVIANGGLYVRTQPNTNSRVIGWHAQGSIVSIKCKVNGENINGNRLWYLLTDDSYGWSSARYIQNIGPAPRWCN